MRLAEMSVEMKMSSAQVDTFSNFVFEELAQGTLPFTIMHPRRKQAVTARLIGDTPYRIGQRTSNTYSISFTLLVIE